MAKAIYTGIDGVAREVTQPYIGVDGVARAVTSAYVGVGGVARKCFSSGVTWLKYNCSISTTWKSTSSYNGSTVGETTSYTNKSAIYGLGPSYVTRSDGSFYVQSANAITYPTDPTDYIGYYSMSYVGGTSLNTASGLILDELTAATLGDSGYDYSEKVISIVIVDSRTYSKGSTSYGEIVTTEGSLPEDGTLIEGSATGSYCILKVGSVYYYYTKVT